MLGSGFTAAFNVRVRSRPRARARQYRGLE